MLSFFRSGSSLGRWMGSAALLGAAFVWPAAAQTPDFGVRIVNGAGRMAPGNHPFSFQLEIKNISQQPRVVTRVYMSELSTDDNVGCGREWFGDAGYTENYPHLENETNPPNPPHPLPSMSFSPVSVEPGQAVILPQEPERMRLYMIAAAGNPCQSRRITVRFAVDSRLAAAPASGVAPVPALGSWALAALGLILGGVTVRRWRVSSGAR